MPPGPCRGIWLSKWVALGRNVMFMIGTGDASIYLTFQVLTVGNFTPPNISYQFTVPLEYKYMWKHLGEWESCDKVCKGRRKRIMRCVTTHTNGVVADHYCRDRKRPPVIFEKCNTECTLKWVDGEFEGECDRARGHCRYRLSLGGKSQGGPNATATAESGTWRSNASRKSKRGPSRRLTLSITVRVLIFREGFRTSKNASAYRSTGSTASGARWAPLMHWPLTKIRKNSPSMIGTVFGDVWHRNQEKICLLHGPEQRTLCGRLDVRPLDQDNRRGVQSGRLPEMGHRKLVGGKNPPLLGEGACLGHWNHRHSIHDIHHCWATRTCHTLVVHLTLHKHFSALSHAGTGHEHGKSGVNATTGLSIWATVTPA